MKNNLARLQFVNIDLFYVVTIWEHEISMQGHVSSELIKYCTDELGIVLEVKENGWLQGSVNTIELGNLKITLV
jgi:hypothetical protein